MSYVADLILKFYVALSMFILTPMFLGFLVWYVMESRRDRTRKIDDLYEEREQRRKDRALDLFEISEEDE